MKNLETKTPWVQLWHVSPSKIGILVWFGDFIQGTEWRTIVIWHDDWPPNSQFDPENSLYFGMIDHHLNMIHELRYCVYIYIKILYKYIYIYYIHSTHTDVMNCDQKSMHDDQIWTFLSPGLFNVRPTRLIFPALTLRMDASWCWTRAQCSYVWWRYFVGLVSWKHILGFPKMVLLPNHSF